MKVPVAQIRLEQKIRHKEDRAKPAKVEKQKSIETDAHQYWLAHYADDHAAGKLPEALAGAQTLTGQCQSPACPSSYTFLPLAAKTDLPHGICL